MKQEIADIQAGCRKGRGIRDQIANIRWIIEKARELQKDSYFCFINYTKAFDCVDHKKLWKILKEMEYQTTLPGSWEIYMQVRKQQLELDMEQQTGSKQEKEYVKSVYCHPAYLTSMQSTSWETLGWIKHKLKSRWLREISITSDMQMTPPLMAESEKPLEESESGDWKSWLKAQHSENEDHAMWSITSWEIDGATVETVSDFIFVGSKITVDGDCSH